MFVLKRLGHALVVMVGVSIVVFALVHLVPGDPVRLALGTRFDQATYDALRAASGLDKPMVEQYFSYLGNALTGNLGVSFRSGAPVTDLLLQRLPATLSLAVMALLIALLIAFPLGTASALNRGKPVDVVVRFFSQLGVSIPDFWLGILLILLFSTTLSWLPSSGYVAFTDDPGGWLRSILLPAFTVGTSTGAIMTRYVRSSVLENLGADHVRTARSKGLRERTVLASHVLRNALVPVITVGGTQLAGLLGGVVVVEVVFAWPGLGRLVFDSVSSRDYPVIQGAVLLIAVLFLVINFLVDVLYSRVDPRIKL